MKKKSTACHSCCKYQNANVDTFVFLSKPQLLTGLTKGTQIHTKTFKIYFVTKLKKYFPNTYMTGRLFCNGREKVPAVSIRWSGKSHKSANQPIGQQQPGKHTCTSCNHCFHCQRGEVRELSAQKGKRVNKMQKWPTVITFREAWCGWNCRHEVYSKTKGEIYGCGERGNLSWCERRRCSGLMKADDWLKGTAKAGDFFHLFRRVISLWNYNRLPDGF